MPTEILVVDDNRDILENIRDYFSLRGWNVDDASTGPDALERIRSKTYDLIVLDVGLPGLDGIMLCRMIRTEGIAAPVIMLTARDTVDDRVEGLEAGADDYVVKPFSLRELAARVEARLRSHVPTGAKAEVLRIADLELDLGSMRAVRAGVELKLNPTCLKLLRELMRASPAVVDRTRLEFVLWQGNAPGSDSLRSNLYLLRQQVDKPFNKALLHTHPGFGWSISERQTC